MLLKWFLNYLFFSLGVGFWIDVDLIGRFSACELSGMFWLPLFFLLKKIRINTPAFRLVIIFWMLFVVGVCISDFFNDTPMMLYLRGIARPMLIMLSFLTFVTGFAVNPRGLVYFIHGMLLGAIFFYFIGSSFQKTTSDYNFLVFRWRPIIVSLGLVVGYWLYNYSRLATAAWYFLITVGGVLINLNRSFLLVMFVTSGLFLLISLFRMASTRRRIKLYGQHYIMLGFAVLSVLTVLYFFYIYAAPRGILGIHQMEKFQAQSGTTFGVTPWGFLLAGRYQLLTNFLIIKDHFFLGLGSWPDMSHYMLETFSILGMQIGVDQRYAIYASGSGLGHSILLGTWSQNGLMPAMFWMFVFYASIKVLLDMISRENAYTSSIVAITIGFYWAFLFTPLSPMDRITTGIILALYVLLVGKGSKPIQMFMRPQISLSRRNTGNDMS